MTKRIAIICTLLIGTLTALADEVSDTLVVYKDWAGLVNGRPTAMVIDPYIDIVSPWEIYFSNNTTMVDRMLDNEAVAVALGDSVWMINTRYLAINFEGPLSRMDGYAPMLFNEKVLMFEHASLTYDAWGQVMNPDVNSIETDLYWVDLAARHVYQIDHKVLSSLLAPYHDLQMRFDGMKDRKKRHVIRYFLNELIRRIEMDDEVPTLDCYD